MKRRRITAASLGILALVIIAFGMMLAVNKTEDQLAVQADRFERLRSLSHQLETAGYELVSLSTNLDEMLDDWSDRVDMIDGEVEDLSASTEGHDNLQIHIQQLESLWDVRHALLLKYEEAVAALIREFPQLADNNPGLLGLYQSSLHGSGTPGGQTADLHFVASNLDRLDLASSDFDEKVGKILETIEERSDRFESISGFIIAFIIVAVVAGTAVILIRINRMHRSVVADNTARRDAERAARRSERDLLITLQSIGDAVFVINHKGRITRMNLAAERLVGWTSQEAVGKPADVVLRLGGLDQDTGTRKSLSEVLAHAPVTEAGPDLRLRRKDGTTRRINGSSAPMRSATGRASGAVLALRDVTERHRLEERLRQTQKLESIGQLAGGVAHDFNNLLQVVLGNVAMLSTSENLDQEDHEVVREIKHAGRRASELTDQLLAFSRRQTLAVKSEDLAALVERSLRMVRRLCPPQIEIEFQNHDETLHVLADGNHLEQVLINLVLNARDAMPDGGRIRVTISEMEVATTAGSRTDGERPGRFGCLCVSDDGVGMSNEIQSRIFEPFFTTKEVGAGSGLGLSMVHGIVQQHGGFINVDSQEGKGTTIAVHVPIDSTKPEELADPTAAVSVSHPIVKKRKILVAEDDPSVRSLIARLLRKAGHEMLLASNGVEACDLIDLEPNDIDLIMTDVVMPMVDGVRVAYHARNRYPAIPVVFCTGQPESLRDKKMVEQPWALLLKPWSVPEFHATIQEALEKAETPTF